ncbi:MAG: O-antigen ligase family protein, partial [Flavobacteriales bacterium]
MKRMLPYIAPVLASAAWLGIGVSYHSIYLAHVVLLFSFLMAVSHASIRNSIFEQRKWIWFWVLSGAVFLAHIFFVTDTLAAVKHLIILALGSAIAILIPAFSKVDQHSNRMQRFLTIILVLDLFIALLETTGMARWPIGSISNLNVFFGYPNLLDRFRDDPVALSFLQFSPTGFHWNPNDCCLALLIPLPLMFARSKRPWLSVLYTIAIFFLMLMAGARLLMFLMLVTLCIMSIFSIFPRKAIALSGVLCVAMMLMFYQFSGRSQEAMKPVGEVADNSSAARIQLMERTFELFKSSHGLGVGGGQAQAVIQREGGFGIHHDTSIHNFWLEWLTEGGVILALA